MNIMLKTILSILMLASFSVPIKALETEQNVDLSRYLGKWYEIARFDAWFERDCTNVSAEYSLNPDGTIKVLNSCNKKNADGKRKQSIGRAIVVDKETNAKLKVSFLPIQLAWLDPFFSGNYWILKLNKDYTVVLIGEPSRKYLWILSRKPTLDQKQFDEYVDAAKQMGFDITKLHKTEQ